MADNISELRTFLIIEFIIIAAVVLVFGAATYQRNFVWKNDFTLWSDVINKSPGKDKGYNELGMWYYEKVMIDIAMPYFEKSLSLRTNPHAYNNLGLCLLGKGQKDIAIEHFQKAIGLMPNNGMFHINLGIAYLQAGQYDDANREMQLGIELRKKKK